VLTQRLYESGPYIIRQVVENAVTGPAYKVVVMKTGKEIKNLVSFDRMKTYYPEKKSDVNSAGCDSILQKKNKFTPAECIIRDKVNKGVTYTWLSEQFLNGTSAQYRLYSAIQIIS